MSTTLTGVVRSLERTEQTAGSSESGREQVLNFRLEHTDQLGDITGYSQIEMRAEAIRGAAVDGDRVEVQARPDRDGIVRPRRIKNLTTNSVISLSNHALRKVLGVTVAVLMFALFGAFVLFVFPQ